MIARNKLFQAFLLRIILGFTITSMFVFAITHASITYIGLLGISAFYRNQPIGRPNFLMKRLKPYKSIAAIGILSILGNLLIPTAASAQWNSARGAATDTFGPYVGAPTIELLFTAVFLLLFFLVIGGLSIWGYKSFRNEEASVPMSAFIVGIVIYIGGEVFGNLFFGGAIAGPPATPPAGNEG